MRLHLGCYTGYTYWVVLHKEVLYRLDPIDRTLLAQVGRPWPAAVVASGLPRASEVVLHSLAQGVLHVRGPAGVGEGDWVPSGTLGCVCSPLEVGT